MGQKIKDLPEEDQAPALWHKKGTGRRPILLPNQRAELVALVKQGAKALGFSGDVWTSPRLETVFGTVSNVQSIAKSRLHVQVGLTTIKKFLHAEGFSVQKPEVKATQQVTTQE